MAAGCHPMRTNHRIFFLSERLSLVPTELLAPRPILRGPGLLQPRIAPTSHETPGTGQPLSLPFPTDPGNPIFGPITMGGISVRMV